MLTGTAKPMFCANREIAVLIPTTSPATFTSGPPELPKLIAASVWMRLSKSRSWPGRGPRSGPCPEMTPTVTVLSKLSGSPMAMTHSPTRMRSESPSVTRRERRLPFDLQEREVRGGVAADDLRLVVVLVRRP